MAAMTEAAFTAAYKHHYTAEEMQMLTYKNRPLYALMEKDEDFGGDVLPIPTGIANPQGRSATFSYALANQVPSNLKSFNLIPYYNYGTASIARRTMLASNKAPHDAWIKARIQETDGMLDELANDIAIDLFQTGSGARSQIATNATFPVTGPTIQVLNNRDIQRFEIGQTLVFGPNANGAGIRAGQAQVVGISRDVTAIGGTLTFSGNLNALITAPANGDYIFVQGDAAQKMPGLLGWLPVTNRPTVGGGDNWFGVDRSADVTRLAGCFFDGSGLTIEEAWVQALGISDQEGGEVDYGFCNYRQWANLENALGSRVRYAQVELDEVKFGMRGIQLQGPAGPVTILADRFCPDANFFLLQMNTWKIYSTGPAPALVEEDGNVLLRSQTIDGFDIRAAAYLCPGCHAVGKNLSGLLPV
jgi:hypothetical protein